jgi:serine protease Do
VVGLGLEPRRARADGEPELRESAVVKSIKRVRPAVVSLRTTRLVQQRFWDPEELVLRNEVAEREGGLGSGVIFHPAGFVITNAHVIAQANNLYVHRAGEERSEGRRAVEFAVDPTNDLAILRILPLEGSREPETFPFLALGRSGDLMLGETVMAVGNPFKLGLSVSTGVIAGLERSLTLGRKRFDDFIQVDAAINPGNSGGALLDVTGRWIGVTTAIYRRVYGAEGIGFAIPADRVRGLVGAAFKRRVLTGEWLGIDEGEGPGGGAAIKTIFPRGPAGAAGLKRDDVLVSVNGKPTLTLYDYAMEMLNVAPGSVVRLGVVRAGRELAAPVPVQLLPVPTEALSQEHFGLVAADMPDYEAGVVVRSLRAGGPAAAVGVRVGDVVVGLGGRRIYNTDDLLVLLQNVKAGDLVTIVVRRLMAEGGTPRELPAGRMQAE